MHAKKWTDPTKVKYCFKGQRNKRAPITQLFCYSLPFRKSNGRGNFSLLEEIETLWHLGRHIYQPDDFKHTHALHEKSLQPLTVCLCLSLQFFFRESFFTMLYKARPLYRHIFHIGWQFVTVKSLARDNWIWSQRFPLNVLESAKHYPLQYLALENMPHLNTPNFKCYRVGLCNIPEISDHSDMSLCLIFTFLCLFLSQAKLL